jgi:hypothetical protein
MSDPGIVIFLPWVTLPEEVALGGFRFVPLETLGIESLFTDTDTRTSIAAMLRGYVDIESKPITSCTFITKPETSPPWYVHESEIPIAFSAARTLALAAMSEQYFYEWPFAPYINAAAFLPIGQGISPPGTSIAISIRRRDGERWTAGWKFGQPLFQQPLQIRGTKCPDIPHGFVAALEQARRNETKTWDALNLRCQSGCSATAKT